MVTEVRKVAASTVITTGQQRKSKTDTTNNSDVRMAGQDNITPVDKSCDGKFSFSEALKNFGKGLVSPITNMFSSPENLIAGLGMIAGSALLIAATGGAAAPLLVAAGVATGAFQAGKGIYKIATAKNGDDVEKAFYDVGGATSTIGLSVAGAKASLKQANFETGDLNLLTATKKCFTASKDCAVDSIGSFTSGAFKSNLLTAYKNLSVPKNFKKYAKEIAAEKRDFQRSFDGVRDTLPEEFRSSLGGRSKSELSILSKIINRRDEMLLKIKKIQDNPELSAAEKQRKIDFYLKDDLFKNVENFDLGALKKNNYSIDDNPELIKALVEDQHGMRLVLKDVSPENMNKLIDNWVVETKKGNVEITEFENYCGHNPKYGQKNDYYFSDEQVARIQAASEEKGIKIRVSPSSKVSGYTCAQLKIRAKNGQIMELQIRGDKINEFAEVEHFTYDVLSNKDISRGNNRVANLTTKTRKAILNLKSDADMVDKYRKYNYDNYMYSQRVELGRATEKPALPDGINPILSCEDLFALHEKIGKLPSGLIKNPIAIKPQLGFIAGIEDVSEN